MLGVKVEPIGYSHSNTVARKSFGMHRIIENIKGGSVPAVSINIGIYNVHEKAETKVERIGDEIRTTDFDRRLTGVVTARLKAGDREGFKDGLSWKSYSKKVVEMEKADGSPYSYRMMYLVRMK